MQTWPVKDAKARSCICLIRKVFPSIDARNLMVPSRLGFRVLKIKTCSLDRRVSLQSFLVNTLGLDSIRAFGILFHAREERQQCV